MIICNFQQEETKVKELENRIRTQCSVCQDAHCTPWQRRMGRFLGEELPVKIEPRDQNPYTNFNAGVQMRPTSNCYLEIVN